MSAADFQESRKPGCTCAACATEHGDQAYTEAERLIDRQREQLDVLTRRARDLEAICSRYQAQIQEAAAIEREACARVADAFADGAEKLWDNDATLRCATRIAAAIRGRE